GAASGRAAVANIRIQHGDTEARSRRESGEGVTATAEPGQTANTSPAITVPLSPPCLRVSVLSSSGKEKRFVCLCEDVLAKDIAQAVEEGFDHIELLKRYSTA